MRTKQTRNSSLPNSWLVAGLGVALLLLAIASSLPSLYQTSLIAGTPAVSIGVVDTNAGVGKEITIPITVTSVSDLFGYQFDVTYDPQVLRYVRSIQGNALSGDAPQSTFFIPPTNKNAGVVQALAETRLGTEGFSGSGTLASLVFTVQRPGQANLQITHEKFVDSSGSPIPITVKSNSVSNTPSPNVLSEKVSPLPAPSGQGNTAAVAVSLKISIPGLKAQSAPLPLPVAVQIFEEQSGTMMYQADLSLAGSTLDIPASAVTLFPSASYRIAVKPRGYLSLSTVARATAAGKVDVPFPAFTFGDVSGVSQTWGKFGDCAINAADLSELKLYAGQQVRAQTVQLDGTGDGKITEADSQLASQNTGKSCSSR